jgi:inorganic pyrophosphatase
VLSLISSVLVVGCASNPYAIDADRHLLHDVDTWADREGGVVNAVIEIPAGTRQKWEVDTNTGRLCWEFKDNQPRVVGYALPYPINYGMVPGTVEAEDREGDGDPIDIVILGEAMERCSVVPVGLIGVMRIRDHGEIDDKLLAVCPADPQLGSITSLAGMEASHPGVLRILETWFTHYKIESLSGNAVTVQGFDGKQEAVKAVEQARQDYLRLWQYSAPGGL